VTILQALARYYDRLPGVATQGWASVKFGWCIVLTPDGTAVDLEDLRDLSGKKPKVKEYSVPCSDAVAERTSGIVSSLFWDKTAYVLGRTAGDGKRTAQEHAAFVKLHRDKLAGTQDEGLLALLRFVEAWQPEMLESLPRYVPDMLDANILFRLEGERGYLHERSAARNLLESDDAAESEAPAFCLITGEQGPIVRLHPKIKGVEGAQTAGARLVSFNLGAFTSLGKEQGANAPTSEAAAFRYGTALNKLLLRDSRNRLPRPIGDTTVVFWADASDVKAAEAVDALAGDWLFGDGDDVTDAQEAAKVRAQMENIAAGRPIAELPSDIDPDTRFHILGLSPNAARLSVRFWLSQSFGDFARALARHYQDMRVEPLPHGWGAAPAVGRMLVNSTAAQRDFKNIPYALAGEVLRAVLSGGRYPQTLLATALMRLRAGDDAGSGWHAAVIRGVLERDARFYGRDGAPMALDEKSTSEAYRLGRLFAALEHLQEQAIEGLKASIRSRFLASASAAPASVFPTLLRLSQHHITKLSSLVSSGSATFHDKLIQEILDGIPGSFPRSLKMADQGRFYIGYYHQRAERFRKRDADDKSPSKEEKNGE
jgi:CRISPR-associated protein Csd1